MRPPPHLHPTPCTMPAAGEGQGGGASPLSLGRAVCVALLQFHSSLTRVSSPQVCVLSPRSCRLGPAGSPGQTLKSQRLAFSAPLRQPAAPPSDMTPTLLEAPAGYALPHARRCVLLAEPSKGSLILFTPPRRPLRSTVATVMVLSPKTCVADLHISAHWTGGGRRGVLQPAWRHLRAGRGRKEEEERVDGW